MFRWSILYFQILYLWVNTQSTLVKKDTFNNMSTDHSSTTPSADPTTTEPTVPTNNFFTNVEVDKMIGYIASDIRGNWRDSVKHRLGAIRELYARSGRTCPKIKDGRVAEDGRWMRDCWTGPYGNYQRSDFSDEAWAWLSQYCDCE